MNDKNQGIPYNGFQGVIEMLRHSDSAFREKILGNIRRRDPSLARRLEMELREQTMRDNSRSTLERSQRLAQTRNYGL